MRALFFDKPPQNSWALPWRKDVTIAVRENRLPSPHFSKPTLRAGVPHVEAPVEVLNQMLTLRIHLDDVTDENGPLRVIPGSHRDGKRLVLDQMVAHGSNRSLPATHQHRRFLHLEFAASPDLPDGYAWHTFHPGLPTITPMA